MGMKMGSSDWKNLNKYGQAIDSIYCRMCNTCNGKCPKKVQIQDIFRALMYAQGYKDMQLAKSTYDNINNQQNASVCTDCNICSVKCKYSLPIKEKLAKAHSLFC